jgi:hypothetical protein
MEKYTLTLRHLAEDENGKFVEIEDSYKASIVIGDLYQSLKFYQEDAVRELCDKMIEFMREEK